MTHTIHLTPNEHAYLLRLLGGASDQGIKTLGEGLNALGVIELRKKMEAVDWDYKWVPAGDPTPRHR